MTRIGLIAQPHKTGIGIQCAEFARHMNPTKVLLTDLTKLHAQNSRNRKQVTNVDWFDSYNQRTVDGIPSEDDCRWLLNGIDVLFVVETPLTWGIFHWANELGVKSVLQTNFEFIEHFLRPVAKPDLFLAPSKWNMEKIKQFGPVKYLPVPIATDRIKRREITRARRFVHVAGYKAHMDRDGTEIVMQAMRYIPNIDIRIYDQSETELPDYWNLYESGDVLVLPRLYGGLSLKLQEATAAGMPVIVSKHDPYAEEPCTIPIGGKYTQQTIKLRAEIDTFAASAEGLAETISDLYGRDISELSQLAYSWAEERSWTVMRPQYEKLFKELHEGIDFSHPQPA